MILWIILLVFIFHLWSVLKCTFLTCFLGHMPKIVFIYSIEHFKLQDVIVRGSNIKSKLDLLKLLFMLSVLYECGYVEVFNFHANICYETCRIGIY